METESFLRQEARWFANSLKGLPRRGDIPDRASLEARALTYQPRWQGAQPPPLTCPRCWIKNGARSTLRSVPGTDEYDILKCNSNACGAEFIVPF